MSSQWNLGRKIHKCPASRRITVSSIKIWLVKSSCLLRIHAMQQLSFPKGQTGEHFARRFLTLKPCSSESRVCWVLSALLILSSFSEPYRGILGMGCRRGCGWKSNLFIFFWDVLSLESLAMWWTCSHYQNESIPHFFGNFPRVSGKISCFQGHISLNSNFFENSSLNFNENFVRMLAQLVCINSDTKKKGIYYFIYSCCLWLSTTVWPIILL